MNFSFPDKVVLITGGGSGIGRATALAFAQAGAKIVFSDQNVDGGAETVAQVESVGGQALFVQGDVTVPDDVKALVATTVEQHGRIDIALNNAGISGPRVRMHEYDDQHFHDVIEVNVKGVWYCMKAEIEQMLEQGHGVIVNLASVAGLVGSANLSAYAASKHAVVGLTKTAALEYVRKGIRINAVCPGFTSTPMVTDNEHMQESFAEKIIKGVPARRLGKPEEIAAAILYLCSEEAAFVVGHTMVLDGGIHAA
ncbi:MAG: glucose 1-dehydrogenase [Chloroflexota bacterium]